MRTIRFNIALLALVVTVSCRKKIEIFPDSARQVSRSDKTEATEAGDVVVREYKFVIADVRNAPHTFVCESRSFPNIELAKISAKKAIAERPQLQQRSAGSHFAQSGRSVWLWAKQDLVWCMLTTAVVKDIGAVMEPVVVRFRRKYEETL